MSDKSEKIIIILSKGFIVFHLFNYFDTQIIIIHVCETILLLITHKYNLHQTPT